MKKQLIAAIIFVCLIFAVPPLYGAAKGMLTSPEIPKEITLTLSESGETITLSAADYLTGCLYAQIPINYPEEALKAQAAAAMTYAARLLSEGAALTDSSELSQSFFTEKKAKEYYGADYGIYYNSIRAAAEYGAKRLIIHDNKPIYAVWHGISAGATSGAFYLWGAELPYIKEKDSEWDKAAVNYRCTNELTTEAVRLALMKYDRELTVPVDFSEWFTEPCVDRNGYVQTIKVGDRRLSGGELWRILGLRSTAFEARYNAGVFLFVTLGHGHGAGLSQYGAKCLAEEGKTAEEILGYYYDGVRIFESIL